MSDVVLAESGQQRRLTRRRPVWLSFGLLVPFAFVVVLGIAVWTPQLLSIFDPEAVDPNAILLPPDGQHWFGTDELGRDLFSRVVYGTSQSRTIGIGATLIARARPLNAESR